MTQEQFNTDSRKGKHLSYQERSQIAVLKKLGHSNRAIAKLLGRAPQTINNEVKRGTVKQKRVQKHTHKVYTYSDEIYFADYAQADYDRLRLNSGKRPKWVDAADFINWADQQMRKEKWSPDVVVGYARKHQLFEAAIIPCTTTMYNWIDRGMMQTKNMDLLEKTSRKTKKQPYKTRRNKRILGPSIDERPNEIEDRDIPFHWEIDTVIGRKGANEPVLLTLVERKTRYEVIIKLENKTSQAVDDAIKALKKRAGDAFPLLFKSITSDNGTEFSGLHAILQDVVDVYFAHPYASWERGTSENLHKMIRRFIPKGQSMQEISEAQCQRIQNWINDYPRKLLGYQTPYEYLVKEFRKACRAIETDTPVSA